MWRSSSTVSLKYMESPHYDQETDQLIWVFTPIAPSVLYVSDDSFCVFYKDSQHQTSLRKLG